jgi:hypothetical protein
MPLVSTYRTSDRLSVVVRSDGVNREFLDCLARPGLPLPDNLMSLGIFECADLDRSNRESTSGRKSVCLQAAPVCITGLKPVTQARRNMYVHHTP